MAHKFFVVMTAFAVATACLQAPTELAASEFKTAQYCGWYAISVCDKKQDGTRYSYNAQAFFRAGVVIDTDGPEYGNFAGGYYCHVVGPKSEVAAEITALRMRESGMAPTAYHKNSCAHIN